MSNQTLDRPEEQNETHPDGNYRIGTFPERYTLGQNGVRQRQSQIHEDNPDNHEISHEDALREQIELQAEPGEFNENIGTENCAKMVVRADEILDLREKAISRYGGRNYQKGSFLERIKAGIRNIAEPRIPDQEARVLFREKEAEVGGTVFSEQETGFECRFFCVDKYTWMFTQKYPASQDEIITYKLKPTNQPNHIIARRVGYADNVLQGKELENFEIAVKVYHQKINEMYAKIK